MFLGLLIMALAVSMDGFSVGISYGIRKMKIPFRSMIVIACLCAVMLLVSMSGGQFLLLFISEATANKIGGLIFICIGVFVFVQFFRSSKQQDESIVHLNRRFSFKWRSIQIMIHVLKTPESADLDHSGVISGFEAFVLGTALSLDSLGAGIAASLLGYPIWLVPIIVPMTSALFLYTGLYCGRFFSKFAWLQKFTFLPGILFICIGLCKL